MDNELWIKIKADIDDVKGKFGSLSALSGKIGSAIQKNLGKALLIGGALGGIGGLFVDFGRKSFNAFVESEQATQRFNTQLKNLGVPTNLLPDLDSLTNELQNVTNFDSNDIEAALSTLMRRFNDAKTAGLALQVSMEYARASGESLQASASRIGTTIQSALSGKGTSALKEFGIVATKNSTAIGLLNEMLKKFQGSMVDFDMSSAGDLASMQTAIGNLETEFGAKLAPAVEGLTQSLVTQLGVWTAMGEAGKTNMADLKDYAFTFGNIVGAIGTSVGFLGITLGILPELFKESLDKMKTDIQKWWGDVKSFFRNSAEQTASDTADIFDLSNVHGAKEGFTGSADFHGAGSGGSLVEGDKIKRDTAAVKEQFLAVEEMKNLLAQLRESWEKVLTLPKNKDAKETKNSIESIFAQLQKLLNGLKLLGDSYENASKKAKEFGKWGTISMMGGQVDALTKFIGNLRYIRPITSVQKKTVDVNVKVSGAVTGVPNSIASQTVPAIKNVVGNDIYVSHGGNYGLEGGG